METISMSELEARRSALLRQLGRVGPLIEGSLATMYRKCGTASCHCHHGGEGHRQVALCKKVEGRSWVTHVPKDLEETVRQWNDEFKRVKLLLKDISGLSDQIIRSYVSSRKAERKNAAEGVVEKSRAKGRRKHP